MDYKIPRLKKGTVPSIFPNCPKYLTKIVKVRKPPTQRDREPLNSTHSSTTECFEKDELAKAESLSNNSQILSPNIEENEVNMDIDNMENRDTGNYEEPMQEPLLSSSVHHEDLSEAKRFALFDSLNSSKNSFNLPDAWVRHDIERGDIRAIEFSQCFAKVTNGKVKTIHDKKIVLSRDMALHALVVNCSLENKTVGLLKPYVSSVEEVEQAIKTLHKLKVCRGCVSPSSICNSNTSFTFKDSIGTLRHNKCFLVLDPSPKKSKICQSCKKGKVTLTKKILRFKRQKDFQRIVLQLSPVKKQKLKILNQKMNTTRKQNVRLRARRHYLEKKLEKSNEELNLLQKTTLESKLNEKKIPKGFEQFTKANKHFIHPNVKLFKIMSTVERLFNQFKKYSSPLELILNELISSGEKFTFSCMQHKDKAVDIIAYIVQFYLQTRMRELVQQKVSSLRRENVLKKKAAKLCLA